MSSVFSLFSLIDHFKFIVWLFTRSPWGQFIEIGINLPLNFCLEFHPERNEIHLLLGKRYIPSIFYFECPVAALYQYSILREREWMEFVDELSLISFYTPYEIS
jgi:hypothetical protein